MAREGYLVNSGEDTIHNAEAERKAAEEAKTPKGKWKNFWFYHTRHVIIAIIAAGVVAYSIASALNTVKPDYNVGLLVTRVYPDSVTDAIAAEMEKYGQDLNGDGKVVVEVNQYYISTAASAASGSSGTDTSSAAASSLSAAAQEDPQLVMAYQTKFTADFTSGTSIIFLAERSLFESEQQANQLFAYTDGSNPAADATDYDRMFVSLARTKLAEAAVSETDSSGSTTSYEVTGLLKDAGICLRCYTGTSIEGKQESYYQASKALFDALLS